MEVGALRQELRHCESLPFLCSYQQKPAKLIITAVISIKGELHLRILHSMYLTRSPFIPELRPNV